MQNEKCKMKLILADSSSKPMRLILTILIMFVLLGYNQPKVEDKPKVNDTTQVLGLLIDSFLVKGHNYMESLYRDSIFKDSIIMQYDSIYTKLLPQVEGVKFKILTEDEICNYATIHESDPKIGSQI